MLFDKAFITGTDTLFPNCLYACTSDLLIMKVSGNPCNLAASRVLFFADFGFSEILIFHFHLYNNGQILCLYIRIRELQSVTKSFTIQFII